MKLFSRLHKRKKGISIALLSVFGFQLLAPLNSMALTGGPSQPEVQSFQPIGVSDMVDPFTGDFSYNLPLLDIDGYPINMVYNSGISNDAEASWVGLGWNINPGVINRNMRGLPDDFNGDEVKRDMNMLPNQTYGVTGGVSGEFFGIPKVGENPMPPTVSMGISYNNYNGIGIELTADISINSGSKARGPLTGSLGITSSSENGLSISPNLSFSTQIQKGDNTDRWAGLGIGTSFNSRAGLGELSIKGTTRTNYHKNAKIAEARSKGQVATAGNQFGGGLGSSIAFGTSDYVPGGQNPMLNFSGTYSFKTGFEFNGVEPQLSIRGYYSAQLLKDRSISTPAYGYLNMQNGQTEGNISNNLLDFNREKESSFNVNSSNLPLSNYTYDILGINGHGIAGSFRPFRNEIGAVYDPMVRNTGIGASGGGEAGGGNLFKLGLDLHVNYTNTESNVWTDQNNTRDNIKFRKSISGAEGAYEPVYYKQTGELSVDDESEFSDKIMKGTAVRIGLEKAGRDVYATDKFVDKDGNQTDISSELYRKKRVKRSQVLTYLTRGEISRRALTDYTSQTYNAPSHHVSEVSVIRADGARYYYGIPAYNITQEETSFALGSGGNDIDIASKYRPKQHLKNPKNPKVTDHASGLILYHTGDNTIYNDKGLNHYYNSQTMPAYAHSYLLTAILSPEYVDIDGIRGPSAGDLGNYTVFEYKKIEKPYKWRVPYEGFAANYNEGMKSTNTDDQGNYLYGEKEIWYLDRVVTKNTVAVFTTESRKDAYGVKNRDGGGVNADGTIPHPDAVPMHLLRTISLYSRPDYETNKANLTLATPIKEVHFEYDYSLCPGVPNNSGVTEMSGATNLNASKGKLTLKQVYFTYGKSYKAKFSPYSFTYSSFNPAYGMKAYDRWGNYKANTNGSYDVNGALHNAEYPYVVQDKTQADQYSSAWNLSEIQLPSGGKIKVTYESDDYAYVQNKKAMQMFMINSIGDDPNDGSFLSPNNNKLMEDFPVNSINNYLTFRLRVDQEISGSLSPTDANNLFKERYLKGIDNLYFRALVNLTRQSDESEYVSGYAEIDLSGCGVKKSGSGNYDYGYIYLKDVGLGDKSAGSAKAHPISKAAWQFGRTYCPRLIYDQPAKESMGGEFKQIYKALINALPAKTAAEALLGPNRVLQNKNFGKKIKIGKSFIRLNTPDGFKFGGGGRVKKIEMSDEWASMVSLSGNPTYTYGQEYTYTTKDESTGNTISSGVAAYEPALGGDENPWRQPVYAGSKEEKLLAPDDKHYSETPFGESLFPSPSVGYSRVSVRNLSNVNVRRHATGYVVNEFYTAKDFPTIVDQTPIDYKSFKTKKIWNLLNKSNVDYMTTSQGYVIEMNDMHGKPKATWVYAEGNEKPISGMEYKYNCEKYDDKSFRLKNDALIVRKDGTYDTKEIGVEYDMFVDFREEDSKTYGGGTDYNTGGFIAALFPITVPMILPEFQVEKTRYRSAVVTKVVYRYGITKETIAYDAGASVPTKTLAYDAETGQVLLTMTKNEFEDDIYSFQYPAHWFYESMGAAYKNLGAEVSGVNFDASGQFTLTNAKDYFFPGDEFYAEDDEKGWITDVTGNTVTAVNFLGKPYKPGVSGKTIKVVRSGRRNVIAANIGTITSTVNPLNSLSQNNVSGILSASAQVFKEGWKTYCECFTSSNTVSAMSQNPYVNGQKGILRPYKAYAFLTDRTHTLVNNNTSIREDGQYTSFTPFWQVNDGVWSSNDANWQWTTEITEYGPYGEELENKDALERFSSAIFGYNHSLPTAVAANAKRKAIGYDGAEDYDFIKCSNDHFGYKSASNKTVDTDAHTGKKSIKVLSTNVSTIRKTIGDACVQP